MSVQKNANKYGVLVAIEAGGYGQGGVASAATDGFHVHEEPDVQAAYQFDGARDGRAAGTGGSQVRDAKAGRSLSLSLVHRARAGGSAYSASVKPTVDRLLRAHGMLATLASGVGAEKWIYTPFTDGTWESVFGELYLHKELHSFKGAYVRKIVHTAKGLGIPTWTFELFGIAPLPTDAAVPTITYPGQDAMPRAAASVLTLQANGGGAFQGKVRESTVTMERELTERQNQAEAGGAHPGAQLGSYTQTMDVLVEATNLTASPYTTATLIDPYRMADEGRILTATLGINQGVQYKRYKFQSGITAQITDVSREKDGAIVLYRLAIALNPESEVADNGLSVVWD